MDAVSGLVLAAWSGAAQGGLGCRALHHPGLDAWNQRAARRPGRSARHVADRLQEAVVVEHRTHSRPPSGQVLEATSWCVGFAAVNACMYADRVAPLSAAMLSWTMIRRTQSLDNLERRYARDVLADRTFLEALAVFEALWHQARLLNPGFPGDWREDVASDLVVARVLNGLPADA